ncbi:metallophosphoesterase [Luteolibacter ambystomatis]|uniref:Metallophosphoesterase n=1 Tax=Luteolibacter ambystomatis TaxID=2824561 RepID=A0A975J2I8_9BACT|nr:metallophosphoesterase [Luteolibacter ambystomatis]QUE52833.1 metallophosphoesterase [Luteolibacter ambystomatis]
MMLQWNRRRFLTITLPALAGFPALAGAAEEEPEKPLRFGVIADPQYADAVPKGTRHYRASLKKLEDGIAELNRHDLAFTVTLGDLIDHDFASFEPVLSRYGKLRSPHRIVLGNHDFDVTDDEKPKVLEKVGLKSGYQSFVHGSWRFALIDATEISTFRYPAADPRTKEARERMEQLAGQKQSNAQPWNGAVGTVQLEWLESELTAAKAANQRVVICGHFPLLPADNPHRLWNAGEVVKVIERHPHVAAYLNGHDHQGNYAHAGHCHYVNFKGMVETATDNPFAVVSCYRDRITVEGFGPEPTRERLS